MLLSSSSSSSSSRWVSSGEFKMSDLSWHINKHNDVPGSIHTPSVLAPPPAGQSPPLQLCVIDQRSEGEFITGLFVSRCFPGTKPCWLTDQCLKGRVVCDLQDTDLSSARPHSPADHTPPSTCAGKISLWFIQQASRSMTVVCSFFFLNVQSFTWDMSSDVFKDLLLNGDLISAAVVKDHFGSKKTLLVR